MLASQELCYAYTELCRLPSQSEHLVRGVQARVLAKDAKVGGEKQVRRQGEREGGSDAPPFLEIVSYFESRFWSHEHNPHNPHNPQSRIEINDCANDSCLA